MQKYLLIFILFISSGSFSQNADSFCLEDELTGEPLRFATVEIIFKSEKILTDSRGRFSLNARLEDSIRISSIGYISKSLVFGELTKIIKLTPQKNFLPEIQIKHLIPLRIITLGNGSKYLKKKVDNDGLFKENALGVPYCLTNENREFAEKISLPDSSFYYLVRKIIIPVMVVRDHEPWELKIWNIDSITGHPGEILFVKGIDVKNFPVKKDKIIVDLISENILLGSTKSFFISVTSLGNNGQKPCNTNLMLGKTGLDNSYTRDLSHEGKWFNLNRDNRFNHWGGLNVSTLFAVELQERIENKANSK